MWKRPLVIPIATPAIAWANGFCPRGLFWQFRQLTRQYSVSVMASATNTRAFNALFDDIKANSREVQSLSSAEYFVNRVPIVEFLTKLRAKGNFVSSLGLTSMVCTSRQVQLWSLSSVLTSQVAFGLSVWFTIISYDICIWYFLSMTNNR
jgi:hypothetical protein